MDDRFEVAFDGAELVTWQRSFYGPTCTQCGVRFCQSGTVCLGCTPTTTPMSWGDDERSTWMSHDRHTDGCASLDRVTSAWHNAFCRWYDHDRAGHKVRALLWGVVADQIIRVQDVTRRLTPTR